MVIGSSVNSGTGAVAGRDCGILSASASESVLRVRSFPSGQKAEAGNKFGTEMRKRNDQKILIVNGDLPVISKLSHH